MALSPHQKIINKVARKHLKPLGFVQKSRSRLWYSDYGLLTVLVEFQPFSGRQGTALNTGANIHWLDNDYFSYDIGGRSEDFIHYQDDSQFENDLEQMMNRVEVVLKDDAAQLATREGQYQFINDRLKNKNGFWSFYHRANALAMTGETEQAQLEFEKILTAGPINFVHSGDGGLLSTKKKRSGRIHDKSSNYVLKRLKKGEKNVSSGRGIRG